MVLSGEKYPKIGAFEFFYNVVHISVDQRIIGISKHDYFLNTRLVLVQQLFMIPHFVTHTIPTLVKS
jgi:hypothetical protein